MQAEPANASPLRLSPSALLLAIALVAALIFGSAFNNTPQPDNAPPDVREHYMPKGTSHADTEHDKQADQPAEEPVGPIYFAASPWSDKLGLATHIELKLLALAGGKRVDAYTLHWHEQQLIAVDRSPIQPGRPTSAADTAPDLVFIAIDYTGPSPSPEFGAAAQAYVETYENAKQVVVIAALPGPEKRPEDQDPYDWTYLWTLDNTELIDWADFGVTYDRTKSPADNIDQLFAYLAETFEVEMPGLAALSTQQLVAELNSDNPTRAAIASAELAKRSPYTVVPALESQTVPADQAGRARQLATQLRIRRMMGIHADELIKEAAASDDLELRALAARSIGDLTTQTTNPLGLLTPLAEDRELAVRLEALKATNAMPGRRAAGVAQLVEPYPMSDMMRRYYNAAMQDLLAYGPPIQADSRADRIRRMPITQALAQPRDLIACKVLLGREDLPDAQIKPLLKDLAKVEAATDLASLIALLKDMNPSAVNKRRPLLDTLINWDAGELKAQQPALVSLAATADATALRHTAAAAILRSDDADDVIKALGNRPVTYQGLALIKDKPILKAWAPTITKTALSEDADPETRTAALDAIALLPADNIDKPTIDSLLNLARTADAVDLRFAAIRAINNLPTQLKPADTDDLTLTSLTLTAVPGQTRYDTNTLTATANRPVEITLQNPDNMEHNLVITAPGQATRIGLEVTALGTDGAAAIGYVPESPDVLHAMPMLKPGQSATLRFVAPDKPGDYGYVCTFPGHYTTMIGTLKVVAP